MIIAFFSDDTSALHAALLAGAALARLAGSAEVGPDLAPGATAALLEALGAARAENRHLAVALPLARLADRAVRGSVDLSVVCHGPTPLATAVARYAMACVSASPDPALDPPWMLSCCARARPYGLRVLPVASPPLRCDEAAHLRRGWPGPSLAARAAGLAAALCLAAEDPRAASIKPADLAALLAGPATASEVELRSRLLDLARDLDGGDADSTGPSRPAGAERARRARHLAPRRRPVAPRHEGFASRPPARCTCTVAG
ncbi:MULTISPECIES: hypothetical protein [Methylobacterium]|uniref:hypothetical protein n=1 Tax=Methylobacterium TaxID=407 RepID=UPI00272E7093|nr:hypothetical protein [Methylobacterium sp.]